MDKQREQKLQDFIDALYKAGWKAPVEACDDYEGSVDHPATPPRAEGGVQKALEKFVRAYRHLYNMDQVYSDTNADTVGFDEQEMREAYLLGEAVLSAHAPSPVEPGGVREALIKEVSQFYSSVEDTSLTQQRIDALREHARTVLNAPTTPLEEVVVDEIETLVTQNDKNLIVDKVRAILTLGDRVRVLVTKEKP